MNLGGHVTPGAVGYRRMSLQSIRCEPERIDFAVSGETLLWLRSVKLVCHPMNRARVRIGAGNPQDLLDALSQSIEMRSGLPVGRSLVLSTCTDLAHLRERALLLPRPRFCSPAPSVGLKAAAARGNRLVGYARGPRDVLHRHRRCARWTRGSACLLPYCEFADSDRGSA
jgi:hypothetical protein